MDDQTQGFFNSHNQVFQKAALLPIVQKIAGLKKQGKPAVIRETLEAISKRANYTVETNTSFAFKVVQACECCVIPSPC